VRAVGDGLHDNSWGLAESTLAADFDQRGNCTIRWLYVTVVVSDSVGVVDVETAVRSDISNISSESSSSKINDGEISEIDSVEMSIVGSNKGSVAALVESNSIRSRNRWRGNNVSVSVDDSDSLVAGVGEDQQRSVSIEVDAVDVVSSSEIVWPGAN